VTVTRSAYGCPQQFFFVVSFVFLFGGNVDEDGGGNWGNRGIGLAIVRRLLSTDDVQVVCLSSFFCLPVAARPFLRPRIMALFQSCASLVFRHARCVQVLGSRSLEKGEDAVRTLVAENAAFEGRVHAVRLDVSDSASILEAQRVIAERHGSIFALVNNAVRRESARDAHYSGCSVSVVDV